jgi:hypothetical protein
MRPVKRDSIYLTCCLIGALVVADAAFSYRYLRGARAGADRERIAELQNELRSKQAEINHLIFMRDSEHRQAHAASVRARALSLAGMPSPGLSDDEEDLAQATAQALAAPLARKPAVLSYPIRSGSLVPRDPNEAEADNEDVLPAPQGAAPRASEDEMTDLTPADIDPKHLVNMANIMTGHPVAELTRMKGQSLIRYKSVNLHEDDPVWHILDAVNQAHALRGITLVGKDATDAKRLGKLSDTIVSSGIPSRLIQIKTGDADYQGLEGLLITLRNEGKNP